MKNIKKKATLICVMFMVSLISFAQKDNFDSMIDMKGTYLDQEMINRGYSFVKTEKSGSDAYQNWFNGNKNKCVTIRVSDGRVKSIVDVPNADCNRGSQGNNNNQYGNDEFSSLIDMKGTYLDQEMKNRGYRFVKTEKSGNDAYQNWFNGNKNKCVTVRVSNGRVVSVVNSTALDCQINQGNQGNMGNNSSGQYKDIKGWVASSAYDELRTRGYKEVERYKKDRLWIVWKHNRSGLCIKTGEDGGKIKEVQESEKCN